MICNLSLPPITLLLSLFSLVSSFPTTTPSSTSSSPIQERDLSLTTPTWVTTNQFTDPNAAENLPLTVPTWETPAGSHLSSTLSSRSPSPLHVEDEVEGEIEVRDEETPLLELERRATAPGHVVQPTQNQQITDGYLHLVYERSFTDYAKTLWIDAVLTRAQGNFQLVYGLAPQTLAENQGANQIIATFAKPDNALCDNYDLRVTEYYQTPSGRAKVENDRVTIKFVC